MLDFYFIADEQPATRPASHLQYAGGVEEEEFEMGQKSGLIEATADYYANFRWSSVQVRQKVERLAQCPFHASTVLDRLLNQAQAAGLGLLAISD